MTYLLIYGTLVEEKGVITIKATGIVRKIDDVGRIVLPMELRKIMNLRGSEDSLEIFTDGDKIVLQKYNPSCIFCNSLDDIIEFRGTKVCSLCIKKMHDDIS